jgi:hypothetical protein
LTGNNHELDLGLSGRVKRKLKRALQMFLPIEIRIGIELVEFAGLPSPIVATAEQVDVLNQKLSRSMPCQIREIQGKRHRLKATIHISRVHFEHVPDATFLQVNHYIAKDLASVVPIIQVIPVSFTTSNNRHLPAKRDVSISSVTCRFSPLAKFRKDALPTQYSFFA